MSYEQIINENMGLVYKVIQRNYYNVISVYGDDIKEDMAQVGMYSLCKAKDKFDKNKGIKFSTFAYNIIKNDLHNFVTKDLHKYHNYDMVCSYDVAMDNDEDKSTDYMDLLGEFDDYSYIDSKSLISYIKQNYDERIIQILLMKSNGFTLREIGEKLGITKQRVSAMIKTLQKDLQKNEKFSNMF